MFDFSSIHSGYLYNENNFLWSEGPSEYSLENELENQLFSSSNDPLNLNSFSESFTDQNSDSPSENTISTIANHSPSLIAGSPTADTQIDQTQIVDSFPEIVLPEINIPSSSMTTFPIQKLQNENNVHWIDSKDLLATTYSQTVPSFTDFVTPSPAASHQSYTNFSFPTSLPNPPFINPDLVQPPFLESRGVSSDGFKLNRKKRVIDQRKKRPREESHEQVESKGKKRKVEHSFSVIDPNIEMKYKFTHPKTAEEIKKEKLIEKITQLKLRMGMDEEKAKTENLDLEHLKMRNPEGLQFTYRLISNRLLANQSKINRKIEDKALQDSIDSEWLKIRDLESRIIKLIEACKTFIEGIYEKDKILPIQQEIHDFASKLFSEAAIQIETQTASKNFRRYSRADLENKQNQLNTLKLRVKILTESEQKIKNMFTSLCEGF